MKASLLPITKPLSKGARMYFLGNIQVIGAPHRQVPPRGIPFRVANSANNIQIIKQIILYTIDYSE